MREEDQKELQRLRAKDAALDADEEAAVAQVRQTSPHRLSDNEQAALNRLDSLERMEGVKRLAAIAGLLTGAAVAHLKCDSARGQDAPTWEQRHEMEQKPVEPGQEPSSQHR